MSDKSPFRISSPPQTEQHYLSDSITSADERLSLLENLLGVSRSGVVIMDARLTDMPIVYVNASFEYITGYSASEVIGHNPRFLYREDTDQPGLDELRIALRERRRCTVVLRNYRKDGTLFWNELSLTPNFNEAGVLTHYVGIQNDVTDRNQADLFLAQEASKRSNRRLQTVHAIDRAILGANSSEAVAEAAVRHIPELIPCDLIHIVRLVPDSQQGVVLATWPKPDNSDTKADGSAIQPAITLDKSRLDELALGNYLFINSPTKPAPTGMRSLLSIPLMTQGKLLGSLDLQSRKANIFSAEDIQIAQEVAAQVAIALAQSRLHEQMKSYARNLEKRVYERTGELTRIKDRAEAVLNNSTNGIILAHQQKGIEQTNQAFNQMFGCQPDEYFHFPLASLAVQKDVPLLARTIKAAAAGEEVKRVEIRALRRDGSVFAAEFGVSLIDSEDPDFQRIVCTVHDITERKQAEEALRESEERFRLLTEAAPVAIVIADDHGKIVLVNIETEAMFGYSRNDMIGQPVEMLMPAAHRSKHISQRKHYFNNPHTRSTGIGMELRAQRKDGSLFPVEIGLRTIELTSGVLVMSFIIDISERHKAQAALQTTKDQLQAILDNSSAAIFVKDNQGRYIVANRRFCEMLDLPDVPVEGKTDSDLFDADRVEAMRTSDELVLTDNRSVEVENHIQRSDGTFTLLTVKFPLRDGGGHPYAIGGIVTDITHRKQVEVELREALAQQQELNELKTRFVSMTSHEFRTPLATIMATTDTLSAYRKQMDDSEIDRRLEKIRDQIDHLKNIIEDVLQLSRAQSNRVEFIPVELDFDAFCHEIIDEFRSRPDISHQIDYVCNETPLVARFDKKLMRQTLTNLIQNAIKYSPHGKTVHVTVLQEDDQVHLQVRDEGIGIPEADIKHLFEAFHRATNVGTLPGTGLGLAIAKEAIELHHGRISLDSEVGKGTTVHIVFPVGAEGD